MKIRTFTINDLKLNIHKLNIESSAESLILGAINYSQQGNILRAIKYIEQAIIINPDNHYYHFLAGILYKDAGDFKQSESSFQKSINIKSNFSKAHDKLGELYIANGYLENAKLAINKALKIKPKLANSYKNLGNIEIAYGNLIKAKELTQRAIQLNPNFAKAYNNLGVILKEIGDIDGAVSANKKAIKHNPNLADSYSNLGVILHEMCELKKATPLFRKAIELRSDFGNAHANLAYILLKQKNFEEGWIEYQWRWDSKSNGSIGKKLKTSKPEWDPSKSGRILIWGEQGLGDQLLFLNLIPDLIDKVDRLILKIDKRLFPILRRSLDKEIVYIDQEHSINESEYDFQLPLGSLPKYLRPTLKSFKNSKKLLLKVNEKKSQIFRKKFINNTNKKVIGISWKSSSQVNKNRSIALEEFILGIHSPGISYVCLQYGEVKDEIRQIKDKYGINIYEMEEVDKFNNIDDLAALVNACDEIVSIENLTLNLAGGIGIKSYILLTNNCIWYNGINELQSYWYPSLNLVRKGNDENWNKALAEIKKELTSDNNL